MYQNNIILIRFTATNLHYIQNNFIQLKQKYKQIYQLTIPDAPIYTWSFL